LGVVLRALASANFKTVLLSATKPLLVISFSILFFSSRLSFANFSGVIPFNTCTDFDCNANSASLAPSKRSLNCLGVFELRSLLTICPPLITTGAPIASAKAPSAVLLKFLLQYLL
jgi:hypothetical protein